jgi:hypothetical protein
MKTKLRWTKNWFCVLLALVLCNGASLSAVPTSQSEVIVNTGYWRINLDPAFSTKVLSVTFNHSNTGTKKVPGDSQVLAVKIAIWNTVNKKIGVRRMDFFVNGQELNYFVVKEEKSQPNVVYVEPGKGVYFFNYYIVDKDVKELKDIKLVYQGINENYEKKRMIIPVLVKKK